MLVAFQHDLDFTGPLAKAAAEWPATGCGELQLCHFGLCTGGQIEGPLPLRPCLSWSMLDSPHLLSNKAWHVLLFYHQSFTLAKGHSAENSA